MVAYFTIPPSNVPMDAATVAWQKSLVLYNTTASGTTVSLVNDLIIGLKNDSLWSKMDRVFLFAGPDSTVAVCDITANGSASANGSPAFTAFRGFTGADATTTVYLNLNYRPNVTAPATNFIATTGHLSVWSNTNTTAGASGGVLAGYRSATCVIEVGARFNDGNAYFPMTTNNFTTPSVANSTALGHFISNRDNATTITGYLNGVAGISTTSNSTTMAAQGLMTDRNMVALATRNNPASSSQGSACQVSALTVGGALSTTDALNLYGRLRKYMMAVGMQP